MHWLRPMMQPMHFHRLRPYQEHPHKQRHHRLLDSLEQALHMPERRLQRWVDIDLYLSMEEGWRPEPV
jgi:hypothetical protein